MLFVIGGLFYWLSALKQEKLITEQQQVQQATKTTIKYNAFITSCLEQATKEGLLLISQQGGLIYTTNYDDPAKAVQDKKGINLDPKDSKIYNTLSLPNKINNKGEFIQVPFWITAPDFSFNFPSQPHPSPPEYPYGKVSLIEEPEGAYFGNFPKSYLVPLCDAFGANSILKISCGSYNIAYDSFTQEEDHHSIQEYLQDYIREKTLLCINLNTMEDLKGYEITEEDVNINITIGENDIAAKFSIPKLLKQKTNKNIQQLQDISITTKVRLKQIHEMMYTLIVNDITNVFFSINTDFGNKQMIKCLDQNGNLAQCAKQGMSAARITGVKGNDNDGKHHSIIEITDEKSKLNGKSYIFQVAVENRLPALDWINNYDVMEEKGLTTITGKVDVVVFTGEELTIDPNGYDPDEDFHGADNIMDHNYYYSGWGIDYDEINNYDDPPGALPQCKPDKSTPLENAVWILDGGLEVNHCISTQQPASSPVADTNKAERQIIKKFLSTKDIGLHTIKIQVCDEIGCDWQNVRILVLPK